MKRNIILFTLALFIFSCKKEETVTVQFTVKSTSKTPNGRNYAIDASKTKIFFSNFILADSAGNETEVKDVFLYKTSNNNFKFSFPEGNFTSMKFAYGLDRTTNNLTPMRFPASNPLSVEEGLYWDMLKYRFSVIEASIDNSVAKDQAPNAPFSMHLGSDTLYTEINVSTLPYNGSTLNIELDMDKLFVLDSDPFQIINFSNHSEPSEIARAISIKNAFVNGIKTSVSADK